MVSIMCLCVGACVGCVCIYAYNAQVRIVFTDVYTLLNIIILLDYDLHNFQSFHNPSLSLFIIKLTLDHL